MSKALNRMTLLAIAVAFVSVTSNAVAQQAATPAPGSKAPAAKGATPAKTKSACAGLSETACRASAGCSWIPSTKRKDGRTVKAYCRLKTPPKRPLTKAPAKAPAPK
jgi:hypothetical protein